MIDGETPPLTRGRLDADHDSPERLGNTPAYAGKTSTSIRLRRSPWKHPRLRGEDHVPRRFHVRPLGNTPAYAGKTQVTGIERRFDRNTPAYAGKTQRKEDKSRD